MIPFEITKTHHGAVYCHVLALRFYNRLWAICHFRLFKDIPEIRHMLLSHTEKFEQQQQKTFFPIYYPIIIAC